MKVSDIIVINCNLINKIDYANDILQYLAILPTSDHTIAVNQLRFDYLTDAYNYYNKEDSKKNLPYLASQYFYKVLEHMVESYNIYDKDSLSLLLEKRNENNIKLPKDNVNTISISLPLTASTPPRFYNELKKLTSKRQLQLIINWIYYYQISGEDTTKLMYDTECLLDELSNKYKNNNLSKEDELLIKQIIDIAKKYQLN